MRILLGGSPCTHWSIAQTKNRETKPEGLGWELFLNYMIALEKYQPRYFLYENNKSMSPAIRAQITAELGAEPILINSALVSAQNRQRLYWTNIPGIQQPEDRGILLRDILESGVCWKEKAYTLKASMGHQNGPSNILKSIATNGHFSANGVAQPVCLNSKSGRGGVPGLQPSLADRIYSIEGKGTTVTTAFQPYIAVPVAPIRVGTIESGTGCEGQGHRAYSVDGKSKTLCGNGGGAGAKTGLYAVPVRVGDVPNAEGEVRGGQAHRIYDAEGKAVTLTARPNGGGVDGPLYAYKSGEKDEKAYPVYEARDGQITIKGERYPIKLADGFYIIRKLTVRECMRLQTVPEDYIFPVSDTQAYKMLGNGWTVDVIAHILSYLPGIVSAPLEVLSMYDGMSCGRLALNKLGAHVRRYYATEIDKYAVKTTQANFPDTVQLGDAFQVRDAGWRLEGTPRRRAAEEAPVQMEINFAGRQLWQ